MVYPKENEQPNGLLQEARIFAPVPRTGENGTNKTVMIVLPWAKFSGGVLHETRNTGEVIIDPNTNQPITWPGVTLLSFYITI